MWTKLMRTVRRVWRGVRPSGDDWHRRAVGGMWDTVGRLQFDFLVAHGLRPGHLMLDVGCGALRGGVHFIAYLEAGHYYGVEHDGPTLEAGRTVELVRSGLAEKRPHLRVVDDFDLGWIPPAVAFDFILAQSLFTHLTPEMIAVCVERITARLDPTGVFFATFSEADDGRVDRGKPHRWRPDERRGTHYPFPMFQGIAARAGVEVEYVGDWGHPRTQKMMAFRHAAAARALPTG